MAKKDKTLSLLESLGGLDEGVSTEDSFEGSTEGTGAHLSSDSLPSSFTSSSSSKSYRDESKSPVSFATIDAGADTLSQEDEDATIQEMGASAAEIQVAAKGSLDFLGALAAPTTFTLSFPPVFQSVWTWLLGYVEQPRTFPQLALGLPRGFGKSTLMKIFLLYCILFTDRKFILVMAATAKLAEAIISDVMDMLDEPNIKTVFGDWRLGVTKDTQQLKVFGFRGRNISIAAIGAEGSVRGLNVKNARPDVMLFDDVQSRVCADSETQSTALETWLVGTAMKAKAPTGCMFLFVANMYPTKLSVLRKLKYNPTWTKFIAGGILADGTSLWEELQPIAQLTAEFENDLAMGHPEIFYSEVLNDENVQANNLIDLAKLPAVPYSEGDIPGGNFIVIDPATDKLGSDAVSIGYFEIHDASPILMSIKEGRFSPGETIRHALDYCLTHNCRLIACESNAYQYSLLYWFDFICQQMGIQGIEAVPIYSGTRAKNARILEMFKAYAAGELYVHQDAKLEVHMQITQFNPLKRDNTDGLLDLLTYAPRVVQEFGEYVIAGSIIESQEYEAIDVPEFNSPF